MNMQENSTFHPVQRKAYTVSEIQEMLGIGRNSAYKLIHSGVFSLLKIGTSIRVSKSSFDSWVDSMNR